MTGKLGERIVALVDAASYPYTCRQTFTDHRVQLPAGSRVLALEDGIARPTMHGGGKHGRVVDLDTGTEFRGIFRELV